MSGIRPKAPIRDLFARMNNTEREFAIQLEAKKRDGMIADWWFEGITLKLADDTRYTPDFLIQNKDGSLELAETKGRWREDALVKCRFAVERFPFPLTAYRKLSAKHGGGWHTETF